jgi:peptidoglycan/LPS O-acetylase OafA/YrhL
MAAHNLAFICIEAAAEGDDLRFAVFAHNALFYRFIWLASKLLQYPAAACNQGATMTGSGKIALERFRQDINGLRAVAVIAVLLYHFGVSGFGGGFIGVDVFFVISGFLMTQIIAGKLAAGHFSLAGFYAGRVRRILPALVALVLVLMAGGFFWLIPSAYKQLGKHAVSALLFYSNFVFSHKAGYFDVASRENWLLHTWSLSVEWQFYILYPLLLMALQKFSGGKFMKRGIAALFFVSLLSSIAVTSCSPVSAFYLLPTRAWEMMAGGLVYFLGGTGSRLTPGPNLGRAGLLMIVIAAVFYSGDMAWPGWRALLPVLGAAMVIATPSANIALTNRVSQFFGNISYSLYLWHWPVIMCARYFGWQASPLNLILQFAAATLLATASYWLIETPFRRMKNSSDMKFLAAGIAAAALAILPAQIAASKDGLPFRVPESVRAMEAEAKNVNPRQKECLFDDKIELPACIVGTKAKPTVAIWGDSHADSVFTSLDEVLKEKKHAAQFYAFSGCPPVKDVLYADNSSQWGKHWQPAQCRDFNEAVLKKMTADNDIKTVIMIARWSVYLKGYRGEGPHPLVVFQPDMTADAASYETREKEYTGHIVSTACALAVNGRKVFMLAPGPELRSNVPRTLAKARMQGRRDPDISMSMADYHARNAPVIDALEQAAAKCGVRVLDPTSLLCADGSCPAVREGRPLYHDDSHLSEYGGRFLKNLFEGALAASR